MKKIEPNNIVSILTEKEFKRFGDFINSPFFNVPERLQNLYAYLSKNYNRVLEGTLTREEIIQNVLSGSKSGDNIRKLLSDFNKEIERFLGYIEFEGNENTKTLATLKQLRRRNKSERYEQKTKEAEENVKALSPDIESYRFAMDLYSDMYLSETADDFFKYSGSLQNESDLLDAFYISSKLLKFQLMLSKQQLHGDGGKYKLSMAEEIYGFIEKNLDEIKQNYPDIYLRYLMLKMFDHTDYELIEEYMNYINISKDVLTNEQQADYFSDLYNYITIRIGEGEHQLRKPLFEIYKAADKRGHLNFLPGGLIHMYTFKQAADTAFFLKELDWAERFLKKYSKLINSADSKNIVNLEFAKFYYYKNDNNRARLYLAKVDYKDYIHYLDAKKFLLCIEYDEQKYDDADLLADSITKYIKNHESMPGQFCENARNFLYYIKTMLNLRSNGVDGFTLDKLMAKLNDEKNPVYARNWLNDKLNELQPLRVD